MYGKQLADIRFSQILSNECMVFGSSAKVREELEELRRLEANGASDQARSVLKRAMEKLSGGTNTVLYDEDGVPSVMAEIPAFGREEMPRGVRCGQVHPAFMLGEKRLRRVYVSKYLNCLVDGRAASLPMAAPARIANFDEAVKSIRGKGAGWMLMPLPLRAAMLLRCLKEGQSISGNTDQGRDYYRHEEMGVQTECGTVLTGSGPASWTHNGKPDGIWDLSGNLNEWDSGFRLMNGEIQLMDTAAMMSPDCDYGQDSHLWQAVDGEGKAVSPGTPGALHFDGHDGTVRLTARPREQGLGNCAFSAVTSEAGPAALERMKLLGLYPPSEGLSERLGWRWIHTEGEALPLSGGAYRITYHSGMFFMGVTKPRDCDYRLSGVRCVYISPEDAQEVK